MVNALHNEQDLLHRLSTGDPDAFTTLFNHYWPRIYSSMLVISKSPVVAEDIAQEIFTRLWKDREKAADIRDLSAYLFIAARNNVLNRLSKMDVESAWQQYMIHKEPGKSDQVTYRELDQLVQQGVQQLPPQQQRAFSLSRMQGLTHEQIAAEMQISRATVKEHIVKALASLRQHLRSHGYSSMYILLFEIFFG
ncbi:MAG: RNA polymerase sigma-70 factor [Chitinophagaceae bacterium]|nr:RNA polymerase sigma-70 factor [Chitinophagaceae bacterium]